MVVSVEKFKHVKKESPQLSVTGPKLENQPFSIFLLRSYAILGSKMAKFASSNELNAAAETDVENKNTSCSSLLWRGRVVVKQVIE